MKEKILKGTRANAQVRQTRASAFERLQSRVDLAGHELDGVAARVNASVDVDQCLGREDARGSIAHVRMLVARGIVCADDAARIEQGLLATGTEIERGAMVWRADREGGHMNLDAPPTERSG